MPLPHVIELDDNWDKKGSHGPVCFYQPGAGSEKRFCLIKLFLRQHGTQPNIAVIFRVTGRFIADFYEQAYENDVILFWKNKSWAKRTVFIEWGNTHKCR